MVALAVELLTAGSLLIYPTTRLRPGRTRVDAGGRGRAPGPRAAKKEAAAARSRGSRPGARSARPGRNGGPAGLRWPGPLSLVVRPPRPCRGRDRGQRNIAVRVPDLELTRRRRAGPRVHFRQRAGGTLPLLRGGAGGRGGGGGPRAGCGPGPGHRVNHRGPHVHAPAPRARWRDLVGGDRGGFAAERRLIHSSRRRGRAARSVDQRRHPPSELETAPPRNKRRRSSSASPPVRATGSAPNLRSRLRLVESAGARVVGTLIQERKRATRRPSSAAGRSKGRTHVR